MTEKQWYKVGGYYFSIAVDSIPYLLDQLSNCHPFRASEDDVRTSDDAIFSLSVRETMQEPLFTGKFVVQFEGEGLFLNLYESPSGKYIFTLSMDSRSIALLEVDPVSSQALLTVSAESGRLRQAFAVNNALMLLYALSTACKNTVLIHASVIAHKDKAYVFLGKSGTGKSTHSRLWLEYLEESYLLNDDNPIIRLHGDEVLVYGSPWSGKTPCYRNESKTLGGIVRLSQYPQNRIRRLDGAAAYAALSPSVSAIRWKRDYADGLHETLENIVSRISIYHLQCRPDEEAMRLCYDTISR